MTLVEALTESGAGLCGVEFLKLDEMNLNADKLESYEWPLILFIPFVDDSRRSPSGAWKSRCNLMGYVLYKTDEATVQQYTSKDIEIKAVAPAKAILKTFLNRLLITDVIDPDWDQGNIRVMQTPTYGLFDVYVHGIYFNFPEFRFVENPSSCTS